MIASKKTQQIRKDSNLKSDLDKEEYKSKIALMKIAAKDKVFPEDMKEVMDDFKSVDYEFIEKKYFKTNNH